MSSWEQVDVAFDHQVFFWNIVQFFDGGYGTDVLDHLTQWAIPLLVSFNISHRPYSAFFGGDVGNTEGDTPSFDAANGAIARLKQQRLMARFTEDDWLGVLWMCIS
jgi:hypothetical protein